MQNLERRPNGIYVARLTVPARLRAVVGASVFIASTRSRNLVVAKLLAAELIAGWRRHLFELDRLSLLRSSRTSMTQQSILKIVEGHPLLLAGGYLRLDLLLQPHDQRGGLQWQLRHVDVGSSGVAEHSRHVAPVRGRCASEDAMSTAGRQGAHARS